MNGERRGEVGTISLARVTGDDVNLNIRYVLRRFREETPPSCKANCDISKSSIWDYARAGLAGLAKCDGCSIPVFSWAPHLEQILAGLLLGKALGV